MSGETVAVVVTCVLVTVTIVCEVMDRRQMRRQTFKRLDEWCKAHPFDAVRAESRGAKEE